MAVLLTTACISGIKHIGGWQRAELFAYDQLLRWIEDLPRRSSPLSQPDSRLLIVGVSESDLQRYGWPLSDEKIAAIIRQLQAHQPRVIGLDLYRSSPQPPGSASLAQQLAAPNLIAVENIGSAVAQPQVPAPDSVPLERVGFNDLVVDPDGVVRRSLLFVDAASTGHYAFPLRIVQQYFPGLTIQPTATELWLQDQPLPVLEPGDGGYHDIDARGYQQLLRYRSPDAPARLLSVQDIVEGQFQPSWVRDKIVLIGSVAPSLKDEFYTPYSADQTADFTQSGVVIHAQIISQLLDAAEGKPVLYRFLSQWGELGWLLGWTILASVLAWYTRQPIVLLLMGGGGIALIGLSSGYALAQNLWLPVIEPTVGLLLAGTLVMAQKALYRSTYDELTGLPGRDLFLIQVQRALNAQRGLVSIAFLDLDRFRLINQSFAHGTGDQVLKTLAQRLRQMLPETASLARVGGDEFAILFQVPREAVEQAVTDIQRVLAHPLRVEHHRLSVTASIGLAIVQSGYEAGPEELLRDAHTAMYRAKALQEYRCEVFATDMRDEALRRLCLESNLLTALDNQEFLLYYQPIVGLQTGQIVGFEALVRWQAPGRGTVSPAEFIPIVEETGLILSLGQWIFQRACRQLKLWRQEFPDLDLKMSINLSRRQLNQSDLVDQIATALEREGVEGRHIQIEITESLIMRNVEAARALMLELKQLGLRFAIDDFGTGYSSLSYLHKFPTDTLKVDRSFVSRIDTSREDWEIVQTIIALGHKLNMTLVAEGIEKSSQVALLRQLDCQFGQGYLFSRPLSQHQATTRLREQPGWSLPSPDAMPGSNADSA